MLYDFLFPCTVLYRPYDVDLELGTMNVLTILWELRRVQYRNIKGRKLLFLLHIAS